MTGRINIRLFLCANLQVLCWKRNLNSKTYWKWISGLLKSVDQRLTGIILATIFS